MNPFPCQVKAPAYGTQAPIEDAGRSLEVISKVLNTPVTLTAEDLLGVSKDLREELKKVISRKRVPYEVHAKNKSAVMMEELDLDLSRDQGQTCESVNRTPEQDRINIDDLPMATFMVTEKEEPGLPIGSVILADPVVQYYDSLAPGEEPKAVYVARECQGLRSIFPLINKSGEEESILDGGSQIVSMAEDVAIRLQIPWDPDIQIMMESANKQVQKTCGLARNVPFVFKDMTLYLQVHVITAPAYKVLLGRPFDTLTESVVQNYTDGGQLITIKDPNSGRRATLPTYERGKGPKVLSRNLDGNFHPSMIWSTTKEN